MSYDYQTDYTGSPISNNTEYAQVGTPSPISNHLVSYVSYVTVPPVNGCIYSPINTSVQVVSPLMNNIYYFGAAAGTPYNFDGTYSPITASNVVSVAQSDSSNIILSPSTTTAAATSTPPTTNDMSKKYTLVGYNTSPTTRPCGRDNKAGWYSIHEKHVVMASRRQATVVLCGDSIVAGLSRYSMIWNKHFRHLNAVNCGIGGDRTQHVLWRMENMNLPSTVRYTVIHCGTNNIDRDSAQDIANGVVSCGLVLQESNPELNVVITGLLPRDLEISRRRQKIIETNKCLKKYCRQFNKFSYMKQDEDWVLENGQLNQQFYYDDHLHLVERGNDKFATSIINIINKLSNNEEIDYSSDEDVSATFERVQGEIRQNTPNTDPPVESPFLEATTETTTTPDVVKQKKKRKRKASSLGESVDEASTSQKRKRIDVDLPNELVNGDICSSNVTNTPVKHIEDHIIKNMAQKDYFFLNQTPPEYDQERVDISDNIPGTSGQHGEVTSASPINISTVDDSSETAKVNDALVSKSTSTKSHSSKSHTPRSKKSSTYKPSELVLKIRRSMEQARQELSKKKLKVSLHGYDSHGDSSQGESTPPPPPPGMRKLISDYGSGSSSD